MQCVFPPLPRQRDEADTRTFQVGERVCLRNDDRTRGRYTRPHPQPGTGRVYIHIIDNRWIGWENVGKLVPTPVSPTAVSVVARDKNLPEDIERVLKTYGGKTRRTHGRRRKTQKPPRRRSTR
jgi:hypothetical protein